MAQPRTEWLLLWFFTNASSVRYQQQLHGFSEWQGRFQKLASLYIPLSGCLYWVTVVVLSLLVLPNFRISPFRHTGNIEVRQFHQIAKSTQNFASNEAENVPNGPHLLKFTIFTSNLHESFMSSHHQAARVGAGHTLLHMKSPNQEDQQRWRAASSLALNSAALFWMSHFLESFCYPAASHICSSGF